MRQPTCSTRNGTRKNQQMWLVVSRNSKSIDTIMDRLKQKETGERKRIRFHILSSCSVLKSLPAVRICLHKNIPKSVKNSSFALIRILYVSVIAYSNALCLLAITLIRTIYRHFIIFLAIILPVASSLLPFIKYTLECSEYVMNSISSG